MDFSKQQLKPLVSESYQEIGQISSAENLTISFYKFCDDEGEESFLCNPEEIPEQKRDYGTSLALSYSTENSSTASISTTTTTT